MKPAWISPPGSTGIRIFTSKHVKGDNYDGANLIIDIVHVQSFPLKLASYRVNRVQKNVKKRPKRRGLFLRGHSNGESKGSQDTQYLVVTKGSRVSEAGIHSD